MSYLRSIFGDACVESCAMRQYATEGKPAEYISGMGGQTITNDPAQDPILNQTLTMKL
ncbi:MAG: hypothetical protein IT559_06370 [Alphaproteobacteria bacterium]|nr:hypothetical protein [Alphaproteobacteria bacterium]